MVVHGRSSFQMCACLSINTSPSLNHPLLIFYSSSLHSHLYSHSSFLILLILFPQAFCSFYSAFFPFFCPYSFPFLVLPAFLSSCIPPSLSSTRMALHQFLIPLLPIGGEHPLPSLVQSSFSSLRLLFFPTFHFLSKFLIQTAPSNFPKVAPTLHAPLLASITHAFYPSSLVPCN